jgi:hypothetical protein
MFPFHVLFIAVLVHVSTHVFPKNIFYGFLSSNFETWKWKNKQVNCLSQNDFNLIVQQFLFPMFQLCHREIVIITFS